MVFNCRLLLSYHLFGKQGDFFVVETFYLKGITGEVPLIQAEEYSMRIQSIFQQKESILYNNQFDFLGEEVF